MVIFDKKHNQTEIDAFVQTNIGNITSKCGVVTINNDFDNELCVNDGAQTNKVYRHTVLGGTFDRLHIAHKILLSEAALRSSKQVTVGVTEENMIKSIYL